MEFLKAAIPLLSGLVGSWIGAQFAFSKFRRERAFDRRLDWYERMTRLLHELRWTLQMTLAHYNAGQREEARRELGAAFELTDKFALVCAERELYASPKSYHELNTLIDVMN